MYYVDFGLGTYLQSMVMQTVVFGGVDAALITALDVYFVPRASRPGPMVGTNTALNTNPFVQHLTTTIESTRLVQLLSMYFAMQPGMSVPGGPLNESQFAADLITSIELQGWASSLLRLLDMFYEPFAGAPLKHEDQQAV